MSSRATCHPDEPVRANGLCNACYVRARRSPDWVPGRPGAHSHEPRPRATCHPDRLHCAKGLCFACYQKSRYNPATRTRGAAKQRVHTSLWRYEMSIDDYDRLLAEQGGVCAVCGEPPKEGQLLQVDHNHDTEQRRGLVCSRCNHFLAALESPLLPDLIAYLDAWRRAGLKVV